MYSYALTRTTLRRLTSALVLTFAAVLFAACESGGPLDPIVPEGTELALLVNSIDQSVTAIPTENPGGSFTIELGTADATPVSIAARGRFAVVPLGMFPFAAVIDLSGRAVVHTVRLPDGSGATGAAFLNDSIALVGNPGLNSVTPVNVLRGTVGAEIPVGRFPQNIVARDGTAYVVNSELENFVPVGPGTVTVIGSNLQVQGTIQLSGFNSGAAAFDDDGRLFVVNAGTFGEEDGALSVVDVSALTETRLVEGVGSFPSAVAVAPDGRVFVSDFGTGILIYDADENRFERGTEDPLTPLGIPPVSSIGFDQDGRLYAALPTCTEPSAVIRLNPDLSTDATIGVGNCPFGLDFAFVPES